VWSEHRLGGATILNYDVAPDGKRIAAILPVRQQAKQPRNQVTFLMKFFDELRVRDSNRESCVVLPRAGARARPHARPKLTFAFADP